MMRGFKQKKRHLRREEISKEELPRSKSKETKDSRLVRLR